MSVSTATRAPSLINPIATPAHDAFTGTPASNSASEPPHTVAMGGREAGDLAGDRAPRRQGPAGGPPAARQHLVAHPGVLHPLDDRRDVLPVVREPGRELLPDRPPGGGERLRPLRLLRQVQR